MTALEAADYAGIVAVITSVSAFVGACAAAYIKVVKELHDLNQQNVRLKDQNEEIHEAVNSNMEAAMNKIEGLHGEVAELKEDKRLYEVRQIPPHVSPRPFTPAPSTTRDTLGPQLPEQES